MDQITGLIAAGLSAVLTIFREEISVFVEFIVMVHVYNVRRRPALPTAAEANN